MSKRFALPLCFGLAMTLAGCFGGGGSSGNVLPEYGAVQSADGAGALRTAQRAATSLPRFGSVTQSHAHNVAGVTTDAADVTLDLETERGVLTVTREDGSSFTLDSARHTYDSTAPRVAGHRWPGQAGPSSPTSRETA